MNRRFLFASGLAGITALVWAALFQGLLPFRNAWGYKEVPGEGVVLPVLDSELPETGLYLIPGHSPPDSLFQARYEGGPIFRVHSLRGGAGGAPHVFTSLLALLLAPLIPAWILSRLCERGAPGFVQRASVVSLFGVFLILTGHLQLWGMELYPLNYSLFLSVHGLLTWVVVGLVLAWKITPETAD